MFQQTDLPWLTACMAFACVVATGMAYSWQRPSRPRFRNTLGGRLVTANLAILAIVSFLGIPEWTPNLSASFILAFIWLLLVSVPLHVITPRVEIHQRCQRPLQRSLQSTPTSSESMELTPTSSRSWS